MLKDDYEKNVLVPHFEPTFENVSSSEIEILDEDCGDETVEVVVLNADGDIGNYDDIDEHFEIEIQGEEQHLNDSVTENDKEADDKLDVQNVLNKEKTYVNVVQTSTRQTRSSKSKNTPTKQAQRVQISVEEDDITIKNEKCLPTPSCSTDDMKDIIYYELDDSATSDASPPSKRRRGRPKAVKSENVDDIDENISVSPIKRYTRSKTTIQRKINDLPLRDADEGESGDDFPARDSDNEDWPAQTTLDDFPNKIIENGLLLVKGKKLMSMICKYYKLECDLCEPKTRFK